MKGSIISLEMLIGVILFSSIFAVAFAKTYIADTVIANEEAQSNAGLAAEVQTQHILFIISSTNASLLAARVLLTNSFGNNYSLQQMNLQNDLSYNSSAISRIAVIGGKLYYLKVYTNEKPN